MCTALTYTKKDHYFGRNLDLYYSYHETVTITPRHYPFHFRKVNSLNQHYALIGMAYVQDDYPLYYDAMNEHGLAMAGLHFPGNATYYDEKEDKDNVTPFEFIPWVLGQCKTIQEVKDLLSNINLLNETYNDDLALTPLHWMISDKEASIVVETMQDGMKIYDNPIGVMTNNPPFDFMMHYLTLKRDLSPNLSENNISDQIDLPIFCSGMAAIGLPGDYTSPSRFVRAAFVKLNAVSGDSEDECVSQFFHLLGAVEKPRGCVRLEGNINDITVYTSCCNQDTGTYYYTTYDNRQISAVELHKENLDGDQLTSYELQKELSIYYHN